MNRTVRIILGVLAATVLVVGILVGTGQAQRLITTSLLWLYGPDSAFDPEDAVTAPDYDSNEFWAALPEVKDPSDLVPAGVDATARPAADVFFIHPTGYLSGASWTSPMNPESAAEENTKWMLAYQASAFNGCCDVYAPRYREATIFSYFADEAVRETVLGFAFEDVARAFDAFLERRPADRPFILASHSQGTHHAKRLLAERIDGTPLHDQLIAAYTIGSVMNELSPFWFDGMQQVAPCESALDLGCVVHWDTMAEGGEPLERKEGSLCTNPLTWRVDEERAEADRHIGSVPVDVAYNVSVKEENSPAGVSFDALGEPTPGKTWAQCRSGSLFVAVQDDSPMSAGGGSSYHGLDYPLFYMDIRENAIRRTNAWFDQRAEATGTGESGEPAS